MAQVIITYKIYLEAEDVSQSRIQSCKKFVKNLFAECTNHFFQNVEVTDESDMDDFTLRLYVDHKVEEVCEDLEDARNFCGDMAEFLDRIAMAQSFLDMEGEFAMECDGEKRAYHFQSESNADYCEWEEI